MGRVGMRLQSERLVVRDLTARDLDALHALLDVDLRWDHRSRADRARWLEWTIADYERALVHQSPYGEYAVERAEAGQLVGLVPSLMPFGLLPGYRAHGIENTPLPFPRSACSGQSALHINGADTPARRPPLCSRSVSMSCNSRASWPRRRLPTRRPRQ